ncbi:hypothetical protein B0O99DRAFT_741779 [Bisporella sp. PMI_857]|nr:hypothetical protein B0O99DRAFT_741779 [Bisporella sp. PMI_857]
MLFKPPYRWARDGETEYTLYKRENDDKYDWTDYFRSRDEFVKDLKRELARMKEKGDREDDVKRILEEQKEKNQMFNYIKRPYKKGEDFQGRHAEYVKERNVRDRKREEAAKSKEEERHAYSTSKVTSWESSYSVSRTSKTKDYDRTSSETMKPTGTYAATSTSVRKSRETTTRTKPAKPKRVCSSEYIPHYRNLGLKPWAQDAEVKAAWRKLSRRLHPEKIRDVVLREQARRPMQLVNDAYSAIPRDNRGSYRNRVYMYRDDWQNEPSISPGEYSRRVRENEEMKVKERDGCNAVRQKHPWFRPYPGYLECKGTTKFCEEFWVNLVHKIVDGAFPALASRWVWDRAEERKSRVYGKPMEELVFYDVCDETHVVLLPAMEESSLSVVRTYTWGSACSMTPLHMHSADGLLLISVSSLLITSLFFAAITRKQRKRIFGLLAASCRIAKTTPVFIVHIAGCESMIEVWWKMHNVSLLCSIIPFFGLIAWGWRETSNAAKLEKEKEANISSAKRVVPKAWLSTNKFSTYVQKSSIRNQKKNSRGEAGLSKAKLSLRSITDESVLKGVSLSRKFLLPKNAYKVMLSLLPVDEEKEPSKTRWGNVGDA